MSVASDTAFQQDLAAPEADAELLQHPLHKPHLLFGEEALAALLAAWAATSPSSCMRGLVKQPYVSKVRVQTSTLWSPVGSTGGASPCRAGPLLLQQDVLPARRLAPPGG
jgi:hypothetical protein